MALSLKTASPLFVMIPPSKYVPPLLEPLRRPLPPPPPHPQLLRPPLLLSPLPLQRLHPTQVIPTYIILNKLRHIELQLLPPLHLTPHTRQVPLPTTKITFKTHNPSITVSKLTAQASQINNPMLPTVIGSHTSMPLLLQAKAPLNLRLRRPPQQQLRMDTMYRTSNSKSQQLRGRPQPLLWLTPLP